MEEQLLVVRLHEVQIRICAAEGAGWFFQQVAFERVGTAMRKDSGRLVWQVFGGVDDFVLDRNFVTYMLTMFDLFNLPGLFCHASSWLI